MKNVIIFLAVFLFGYSDLATAQSIDSSKDQNVMRMSTSYIKNFKNNGNELPVCLEISVQLKNWSEAPDPMDRRPSIGTIFYELENSLRTLNWNNYLSGSTYKRYSLNVVVFYPKNSKETEITVSINDQIIKADSILLNKNRKLFFNNISKSIDKCLLPRS